MTIIETAFRHLLAVSDDSGRLLVKIEPSGEIVWGEGVDPGEASRLAAARLSQDLREHLQAIEPPLLAEKDAEISRLNAIIDSVRRAVA